MLEDLTQKVGRERGRLGCRALVHREQKRMVTLLHREQEQLLDGGGGNWQVSAKQEDCEAAVSTQLNS
jgi:hypothetical protein